MIRSKPARPARRARPLAASRSVAVAATGVTVYGCEQDERLLFEQLAPRFGVVPTITAAPVTDATVALARGNRCISVSHRTPVAAAALRALSDAGVRYVSTRSVGCNHIDLSAAQRLGVRVETVAYSPDSVADYTLMLMLMALRDAKSVIKRTEAHDFRLSPTRGRELRDVTVGVIGTGRIGAAVIERLRGFGGRVLAFDVRQAAAVDYVPLDDLLADSDIVTLHTPLTADTHHLLDRRRIERMKPGAIVVNTGRGPLLDTSALADALERGRLGGAALDVIEGEDGVFYADRRDQPLDCEPLRRLHALPNVLITPHTAYSTDHALRDMVEHSLANCLTFASTHTHG